MGRYAKERDFLPTENEMERGAYFLLVAAQITLEELPTDTELPLSRPERVSISSCVLW